MADLRPKKMLAQMTGIVNSKSEALARARILELLNPATPWNRSLWNLGLCLTLEELREAIRAMREGVLSEVSVKRLGAWTLKLAGQDPGITKEENRILADALTSKDAPRFEGLAYQRIAEVATRIGSDYLLRWSRVVPSQRPERIARSIVSYLLDLGYSGEFLGDWWSSRLQDESAARTLAQLCVEAHHLLVHQPEQEYEVLIGFRKTPRIPGGFPAGWKTNKDLAAWLRSKSLDTTQVRASGGLILPIRAKDPVTAAELAEGRLEQIRSRLAVATGSAPEAWPTIWVCQGNDCAARPLSPNTRGVLVKVLSRERLIFNSSNSSIDAALELLSHLERSSPSAAIAGGWAAIEALLADPGKERSEAAENLAWLVAASFPRQELTALAHKAKKESPRIAADLSGIEENRELAARIAQAIALGDDLDLKDPADLAALRRVTDILGAPAACLLDVQGHAAASFHRLYRQRNLILHGGKTNSIALRASLRTAAKLVGAGMDRVVHGWYVNDQLRPLELTARARTAIELSSPDSPRACVDLLGR